MSELYNFPLEHSTIKGLCFFEIISKCLMDLKGSKQFSVKKLKEDCLNYLKSNEWAKNVVLERAESFYGMDNNITDNEMWLAYTHALKYDAQEISNMATSEVIVQRIMYRTLMKNEFRNVSLDAICGRLDIEGRILSEIYGIKIIHANVDENLSTIDSNTIYLVKRGLNHYEKFVGKNIFDEKSPKEENPSTSAAAYMNLEETNTQNDTAYNLLNDLTPKYTTNNNKMQIDNENCNIPRNFEENKENILDSDTESSSDENTNLNALTNKKPNKSNKIKNKNFNKLVNDMSISNVTTNDAPDKTYAKNQERKGRQLNKKQLDANQHDHSKESSHYSLTADFQHPNQQELNVSGGKHQRNLLTQFFKRAPAPNDTNASGQLHKICKRIKLSKQVYYEGFLNDAQEFHGHGKICYTNDTQQFIDGIFENNALIKVKMYTFIIEKTKPTEMIIRIYGEDCLLTINSCILARISIAKRIPFNNWNQSFHIIASNILNSVQIIKIYEDGAIEQRNDLYTKLLTSIEQAVKLTTSDIRAANIFLHLNDLCNKNDKQLMQNQFLLNMILGKQIFPQQINETCERLLVVLQKIDCETKSVPNLLNFRTELDDINLLKKFKEILAKAMQQYKTCLLGLFSDDSNLEPRNWFDNLTNYQIINIHPNNIKLFNSLEMSTPQNSLFWKDFLKNVWAQFTHEVEKLPIVNPIKSFPLLTHSIFVPLFKIFIELTEELQTTIGEPIETLITFDAQKCFDLKEEFNWPQENFTNKSMDIQIRFVAKLMNHFRPSFGLTEFKYERIIKKNRESRIFYQNDEAVITLHENQLVWIYILDHTLSKLIYSIPKQNKIYFYTLSYSLIECLIKFINRNATRLESLRCIVSNIIKFVTQISSYISNIDLNSTLDEYILTKQIEYLTHSMANQSNETLPNYLSNIVDVYATYWSNRDLIIAKLPKIYPCETFIEDADNIYQQLLAVVKNVVDALIQKQIPMDIFISFMRAYNEFVEDLDEIEYKWYVKHQNGYDMSLLEMVDNKLSGEAKRSYLVVNVQDFMNHLKFTNTELVPINYITKTINHLLIIVNNSLLKEFWPNGTPVSFEMRIQISTQLIAAIRSSFLYLKEQPDYRDFELFFEESTKPFHNVLMESQSKGDFDKRCSIIKESFWYIRKQDEIGIQETLPLFAAKNKSFIFDETILKKTYLLYQHNFNEFIQSYLLNKSIITIIAEIKQMIIATKTKHNYDINKWCVNFKQETIPYLLAGLAAIWSIQQSKDILNIEKPLKPHCIQIVCILRLLSVDSTDNGIDKHLVEVLTGQGKSLVLGLTAALLSLFDYDIKIICYSEYLSKRDKSDFTPYFDTLNLNDNIIYQSFDDMASKSLNVKQNGEIRNIRDLVRDDLLGIPKKSSTIYNDIAAGVSSMFKNNNGANQKTILLVDEVDVLFMKRFFGKTFNLCELIGMNTLVEIQEEIWKRINNNQSKSKIIQHVNSMIQLALIAERDSTFIQFYNKSQPSHFYEKDQLNANYFQLEIGKMIDDAMQVKTKDVIYSNVSFELDQDDNIIAKARGDEDLTRIYSYNNTFSYLKLKKNNFIHNNYDNYGYIAPSTGKISYANLPIEYPLVLGVTGTLSTLSNYQKEVLEQMYQIKKQSLMPSFYGPSNVKFNPMENIKIETDINQWLQTIFRSATYKIKANRSVLICFDTEREILLFETAYSGEIAYLNKLTQHTTNKDLYLREAGVKKNITLLTRGMGRGTDFKTSVTVEKNGGCHVIQTFFSLDENEEIQIRGRTARKDNKGSYELILCRTHLIELGFTDEYSYDKLSATRKLKKENECDEIKPNIISADVEHQRTMEYLKSLQ